jgi:hypothetical protein
MGLRWAEAGNERLFTRDFPIVHVYPKGAAPGSAPLMILMGTHFKSKRNRNGDPESRRFATAQFTAARSLVASYLKQFCDELPVFLAADFNRDIRTDAEPRILLDLMRDTFDLAKTTVPADQRVTQTFHPFEGPRVLNQLDAILASSAARDLVSAARIPRYKNPNGEEKPLPDTFNERGRNPSDHFPVFIDLNFSDLYNRYEQNREHCQDHKIAA